MAGKALPELIQALSADLQAGRPVALGFEAPMWVPLRGDPMKVTAARDGDVFVGADGKKVSRPWSAGAGSGALTTATDRLAEGRASLGGGCGGGAGLRQVGRMLSLRCVAVQDTATDRETSMLVPGRRLAQGSPALRLAFALLLALCTGHAAADAGPKEITASIPLSHLTLDDVQAALNALPEKFSERLSPDEMVYSEQGRLLVLHGRPADISLLRDLLRRIDVGPKQVQVDVSVVEVSETGERDGTLSQSPSVDDLVRRGGRIVARGTIRVVDQESATLGVGQIWTVGARSAQTYDEDGESSPEDGLTAQEVPVGITLSLTPVIHNDGTLTLALDVQDERVIAVGEFGVDRNARNSTTTLRIRDRETVAVGGFVSGALRQTKPAPRAGEDPPAVSRLSHEGHSEDLVRPRVILLTPHILDYNQRRPEPKAP